MLPRVTSSFPIWMLALSLLSVERASAQVISGRVVQRGTDVVIDDATVFVGDVVGNRGRTLRTSSKGAFRVQLNAPGAAIVRVRRLGFRPFESTVLRLAKNDSIAVEVELEPVPQELAPVAINAELEAIKDIRIGGYNARSIEATFITPSQLDAVGRDTHNYLDVMGKLRLLWVRVDHRCVRKLKGGECLPLYLNDRLLGREQEEIDASRLIIDPNTIDHIVLPHGGDLAGTIQVYTRDYTARQRQTLRTSKPKQVPPSTR